MLDHTTLPRDLDRLLHRAHPHREAPSSRNGPAVRGSALLRTHARTDHDGQPGRRGPGDAGHQGSRRRTSCAGRSRRQGARALLLDLGVVGAPPTIPSGRPAWRPSPRRAARPWPQLLERPDPSGSRGAGAGPPVRRGSCSKLVGERPRSTADPGAGRHFRAPPTCTQVMQALPYGLAQGHGLDGRLGRHVLLRGHQGHHDDVLGGRPARPERLHPAASSPTPRGPPHGMARAEGQPSVSAMRATGRSSG